MAGYGCPAAGAGAGQPSTWPERSAVGSITSGHLAAVDEQRAAVGSAEHAGETAAIDRHRLQHLAALADPDTALVRHIGVPDGALLIQAQSVRHAVSQVRPDPAIAQAPVGVRCRKR